MNVAGHSLYGMIREHCNPHTNIVAIENSSNISLSPISMRQLIPAPLLGIIADVVSSQETHASLDSLFMYAGAPGNPPEGSKHVKAQEWLRQVNKDSSVEPLLVAGRADCLADEGPGRLVTRN